MGAAGSATLRRSLLWAMAWLVAATLSQWRFEAGQAIPILWLPGGIALAAFLQARAGRRPLLGTIAAAALGFELVRGGPGPDRSPARGGTRDRTCRRRGCSPVLG